MTGMEQLVQVEPTGGSSALLRLLEKRDGAWRELLCCPACIGKNGPGKQREGDSKTPVGCFELSFPFGILPDPGANMGYTRLTEEHYWCGTSGSEYYNRFMDAHSSGRPCTEEDEHLLDYAGVYNYCMFIGYNPGGERGKGSCIFLHCTGEQPYTAGCVAVAEEVMRRIIRWAKPGVRIRIE